MVTEGRLVDGVVDEISDLRAYLCTANHPAVLVLVHVAHRLSVCHFVRIIIWV